MDSTHKHYIQIAVAEASKFDPEFREEFDFIYGKVDHPFHHSSTVAKTLVGYCLNPGKPASWHVEQAQELLRDCKYPVKLAERCIEANAHLILAIGKASHRRRIL